MTSKFTKASKTVLDMPYLEDRINDISESKVVSINDRVGATENKLVDLSIENSYLRQRRSMSSDFMLETFFDETQTDLNHTDAEVMDDTAFGNNWKKRDGDPAWKNGFLRPSAQYHMFEFCDSYDLTGVGQVYKGAISSWDLTNQCYWLMTSEGSAGRGSIVKLSNNMKDGKIEVLAIYNIPAGGSFEYYTGIDSDGERLYFIRHATTSSKLYSIKINSDGSLGEEGYTTAPNQFIDLTNSVENTRTITGSGDDVGRYNDVVCWDDDNIMVLVCNGTTNVNLISVDKDTLGAGSTSNITGFESFVGGTLSSYRTCALHGNDLYIRMDDVTDNRRFIYKFDITSDISSNKAINSSGIFRSIHYDTDGEFWGGITISKDGDILEVADHTGQGDHIHKRALANALWAESQICGVVPLNCYINTTNLYNTGACMVESDRYYWTADINPSSTDLDIVRIDIQTGNYKHARITGASWRGCSDSCTNGTTLWLMGVDTSNNYEVYFGSLSSFVSSMEDNSWTSTTIDITSWGNLASGIGSSNTDLLTGICHNADNSILYVLNDTDNEIQSLSEDGSTWNQGINAIAQLPNAALYWVGLEYKNGLLYVAEDTGDTEPNYIYVLDLERSDATQMYVVHKYQDSAESSNTYSGERLSFHGNDLVQTDRGGTLDSNNSRFNRMKILEDLDVLQLQVCLSAYNILPSSYVSYTTPITERYFDPEDFTEQIPVDGNGKYDPTGNKTTVTSKRNVPDKYYMVVGYSEGTTYAMSLLHLDEFLSGRNYKGLPRYDVRKVRTWDFLCNGTFGTNDVNMFGTQLQKVYRCIIEKDMIFLCAKDTGMAFCMIDLRSGQAMTIDTSDSVIGGFYKGTISERNDELDYSSVTDTDTFNISSDIIYSLHARTFTKEDASAYNGQFPKTFVVLGTAAGVDVLRIDWGANNLRTPMKIYTDIFNTTTHTYGIYIDPFGYIFSGEWGANGNIYQYYTPIWDINKDSGAFYNTIGTNVMEGYVWFISPDSVCYKTPTGEIKRQLCCSTYEYAGVGKTRLSMFEPDTLSNPSIYLMNTGLTTGIMSPVLFEDMVFNGHYSSGLVGSIRQVRKFYYRRGSVPYQNNWDAVKNLTRWEKPRWLPLDTASQTWGLSYSKDFNMLAVSTAADEQGVFFLFYPKRDQCIHTSTEMTINNNPTAYHYVQNALIPEFDKINLITKINTDITFTDGNSQTWDNLGTVQVVTLEDIENEEYATGTFGDPSKELQKSTGAPLIEGTDYNYDERLDNASGDGVDIYDDDDSGSFDSGKYMRVVHNGTNITNAGGLNLSIRAKNLNLIIPPPANECYVDPKRGRSVLPRPNYWSKCESINNLENAEIGTGTLLSSGIVGPVACKFNNGIRAFTQTVGSPGSFSPHIDSSNFGDYNNITKWTASYYVVGRSITSGSYYTYTINTLKLGDVIIRFDTNYDINNGSPLYKTNQKVLQIYFGSTMQKAEYILPEAITSTTIHHIYVIVDKDGGLSSGKTVRVFLDGVERCSTTSTPTTVTGITYFDIRAYCYYTGYSAWSTVDNIKIWDHVVTEDPSFEYNSGSGREDALHYIYGSGNDYKPNNIDVGYHYTPHVADPAQIEEDGTTEGYMTWNLTSGFSRAGIRFVKSTDSGIAQITVIEDPNGTPVTIIDEDHLELYDAGNGTTNDLELVYWFSLNETKDHQIKVEHSGDHNSSSSSPYYITIREFLTCETLDNSKIEAQLIIKHSNWEETTRVYTLVPNQTTNIEEIASYNGDDSTTTFVLSGENRAFEPIRFTVDGGTTWKYPEDTDLTWGANSPNYDDETIDSSGYFGVAFDEVPETGSNNVQIVYVPAFNTYKIQTTLKAPNDSIDFVEKNGELRLQDHGLELIF